MLSNFRNYESLKPEMTLKTADGLLVFMTCLSVNSKIKVPNWNQKLVKYFLVGAHFLMASLSKLSTTWAFELYSDLDFSFSGKSVILQGKVRHLKKTY